MRNCTIHLMRRLYKYKNQILILVALTFMINILTQNVSFIREFFVIKSNINENRHAIEIQNELFKQIFIQNREKINAKVKKIETTNQVKENGLKYENLLSCQNNYNNSILSEKDKNNYKIEADKKLHDLRIVRGIIIYYPVAKHEWFEQEFKWLYRSWIEMQKYEPKMWRTDLIVFLDYTLHEKNNIKTFHELNCLPSNIRLSKNDLPMCTILDYVQIQDRVIPFYNQTFFQSQTAEEIYHYLFKEFDIFDDNPKNLWKFYGKLKELNDYNYADSILMAFDGYKYFHTNFDFLMRTDMDVFLTPFFAKWLPLNCNDFITGSGGYSHDFNMKRIRKSSQLLGLKFGEIRNLGSTWFSTPAQFRLVSYFTLLSMAYISGEEFSESERLGKVGTILWPGKTDFLFVHLVFT